MSYAQFTMYDVCKTGQVTIKEYAHTENLATSIYLARKKTLLAQHWQDGSGNTT